MTVQFAVSLHDNSVHLVRRYFIALKNARSKTGSYTKANASHLMFRIMPSMEGTLWHPEKSSQGRF